MSGAVRLQAQRLLMRHASGFELRVDSILGHAGETVCLLGPTGSGKTTLLRLLTGLERADAGDVRLDEQPVRPGASDLLRRIVMMPQRPFLQSCTVRENVGFGLKVRSVPTDESVQRVNRQLERCGLQALADQPARTLSGGQMQLVALARALAIESDVLLLDEPTASLDPARVELVERLIAEERSRRPMTIFWATHNLFQARRMADRVVLLLDGAIVEDTVTDDFFQRPSDPRTAEFVAGRMIY